MDDLDALLNQFDDNFVEDSKRKAVPMNEE